MRKNSIIKQRNKNIIENIERIKYEIAHVKNEINMTTNDFLLDSLIYRLKALDKEFQYYITEARQQGVLGFEKIS
jgi:uncharacterized protein (UPF0335 family)